MYRTPDRGLCCPLCDSKLDDTVASLGSRCPKGCGHWFGNDQLEELLGPGGIGAPSDEAGIGARCPVCTQDLRRGGVAGARVEQCAAHGVWVFGRALDRFLEAYADVRAKALASREDVLAIASLTQQIAQGGLQGARATAERIVALERALARLVAATKHVARDGM